MAWLGLPFTSLLMHERKDVDGRDKRGHDDLGSLSINRSADWYCKSLDDDEQEGFKAKLVSRNLRCLVGKRAGIRVRVRGAAAVLSAAEDQRGNHRPRPR